MFPENFSVIGAVVTEIRHFEVSMVVSSAQHSVACLLTGLLCLRVFTRIVLTAKRSHTRTPRLYQNVPWTFRNLFQPVWQPKNASFFSHLAKGETFPVADFSRQSNSLIYFKIRLPENYETVCYDIWTTDRADIGPYSIRKWG